MAHTGYMIVADISGYTAYLSTSELEHAQEILESLINTILKRIHPPIILSRTEGDAVFAYTLDESLLQGQTLLEAAEQIYCSFATELEHNKINTTCDCNACRNMSSLDLKMVVHHGEFGLQKLGNHIELIGSDVNITHRLLKNHVIEKTGVTAYAFFSDAAIKAMRLETFTSQMRPHSEWYEHLGEVKGWVYDLKHVYANERDKRRLKITAAEADKSETLDVPVPQIRVWDYVNEPEFRAHYKLSDVTRTSGLQNGRLAEGTIYHCAHGELLIDEHIVDWQPFDYVTVRGVTKVIGVQMEYWYSVVLTSLPDGGTRIEMHITPSRSHSPILRPIGELLYRLIVRKNFFSNVDQYFMAFERTFITEGLPGSPAAAAL